MELTFIFLHVVILEFVAQIGIYAIFIYWYLMTTCILY